MTRGVFVVAAVLGALAQPAAAQGGLIVYGQGGGAWPALNLDVGSGDDFRPSPSYGAGVALQVSGSLAFRGSATRTSTAYRGTTLTLADDAMRRTYLAGDLQIGFPAYSAWVPYVFLGGGIVRTEPADAAQTAVSSPMARLGFGINRVGGFFVWFAELSAAGYKFDGLGFSRLQVDPMVGVGVAIGLPF